MINTLYPTHIRRGWMFTIAATVLFKFYGKVSVKLHHETFQVYVGHALQYDTSYMDVHTWYFSCNVQVNDKSFLTLLKPEVSAKSSVA